MNTHLQNRVNDLLHDAEAKARAPAVAGPVLIDTIEALEDAFEVVLGEAHVECADVLFEVVEARGSRDGERHRRVCEQPRERDLVHRGVVRCGHLL